MKNKFWKFAFGELNEFSIINIKNFFKTKLSIHRILLKSFHIFLCEKFANYERKRRGKKKKEKKK